MPYRTKYNHTTISSDNSGTGRRILSRICSHKIFDLALFSYLILYCTLNIHNCSAQWFVQSPVPQVSNLNSVHFFNVITGWAVGDNGTIIFTTNSGTNWNIQSSGTTNNLYSVNCYPNAYYTGYAVGQGGIILYTGNNGAGWYNQISGTTQSLRTVFSYLNTIWVAGYYGKILQTTNLGTNWTTQASSTTNPLNSVSFVNYNYGCAVGDYGKIIFTSNGGINWTNQASGTAHNLYSAYFLNSNIGWAVGRLGTILKTTNGGTNWTTQSSGTSQQLNSVYFLTSNVGWVVGNGGTILHTTNGGSVFVPKIGTEIPEKYLLSQNYPNPFNPSTKIKFQIPPRLSSPNASIGDPLTTLKIYDILGKEIQMLVNEQLSPGTYEVTFDGNELPSGTYFYQLKTIDFQETKKLILIK